MRAPASSAAPARRGAASPCHPVLFWRVRVKKNFYSDNVSGAAPEILRAIVESNADDPASYGADQYTQRLERRMAEGFETEVEVYPVGTGTVANGLCARSLCAPCGPIY